MISVDYNQPGATYFSLLSRTGPGHQWFIENERVPLWVLRARQRVIRSEGREAIVCRCIILDDDPRDKEGYFV